MVLQLWKNIVSENAFMKPLSSLSLLLVLASQLVSTYLLTKKATCIWSFFKGIVRPGEYILVTAAAGK